MQLSFAVRVHQGFVNLFSIDRTVKRSYLPLLQAVCYLQLTWGLHQCLH